MLVLGYISKYTHYEREYIYVSMLFAVHMNSSSSVRGYSYKLAAHMEAFWFADFLTSIFYNFEINSINKFLYRVNNIANQSIILHKKITIFRNINDSISPKINANYFRKVLLIRRIRGQTLFILYGKTSADSLLYNFYLSNMYSKFFVLYKQFIEDEYLVSRNQDIDSIRLSYTIRDFYQLKGYNMIRVLSYELERQNSLYLEYRFITDNNANDLVPYAWSLSITEDIKRLMNAANMYLLHFYAANLNSFNLCKTISIFTEVKNKFVSAGRYTMNILIYKKDSNEAEVQKLFVIYFSAYKLANVVLDNGESSYANVIQIIMPYTLWKKYGKHPHTDYQDLYFAQKIVDQIINNGAVAYITMEASSVHIIAR